MRLLDVPRNNLPAALAYVDQQLDGQAATLTGDEWQTLAMLQDEDTFPLALEKHLQAREKAGKPMPAKKSPDAS